MAEKEFNLTCIGPNDWKVTDTDENANDLVAELNGALEARSLAPISSMQAPTIKVLIND